MVVAEEYMRGEWKRENKKENAAADVIKVYNQKISLIIIKPM